VSARGISSVGSPHRPFQAADSSTMFLPPPSAPQSKRVGAIGTAFSLAWSSYVYAPSHAGVPRELAGTKLTPRRPPFAVPVPHPPLRLLDWRDSFRLLPHPPSPYFLLRLR
jgi:hypothetical protein